MPDLKSPEEVAREIAAPETCPCCEEMFECRTGCTFKTDCPDEYDRLEYDRDRCRAVARVILEDRERIVEALRACVEPLEWYMAFARKKHAANIKSRPGIHPGGHQGCPCGLASRYRGARAAAQTLYSLLAPKEGSQEPREEKGG